MRYTGRWASNTSARVPKRSASLTFASCRSSSVRPLSLLCRPPPSHQLPHIPRRLGLRVDCRGGERPDAALKEERHACDRRRARLQDFGGLRGREEGQRTVRTLCLSAHKVTLMQVADTGRSRRTTRSGSSRAPYCTSSRCSTRMSRRRSSLRCESEVLGSPGSSR